MNFLIFTLISLLSLSCSTSGPDYYREQGSSLAKSLTYELKKVYTREQLLDRQEKIESLMRKLKSLIYESEGYLKAHPETEIPLFTRQNQEVSDALQSELNRLLRVEGCRELLNKLFQSGYQNDPGFR